MAPKNYESLKKNLKNYGTKKPKDEKLMEEFSSYLQNLPDAKDLVKI